LLFCISSLTAQAFFNSFDLIAKRDVISVVHLISRVSVSQATMNVGLTGFNL